VYACVGGGSNALGIFQAFVHDPDVELVAVEGGGEGVGTGRHASRIASGAGRPGVAHGYRSFFLQTGDGQMLEAVSVAAGLDYVGVSPILAAWHTQGRVRFAAASDQQAIEAARLCIRREGLIPALESSHAFHQAFEDAKQRRQKNILINMSGRGDKDIFSMADALGDGEWQSFLRRRVAP
jgi:tryptophan synthase beta chain